MPTNAQAMDGNAALKLGETFARRTLPAIVALLFVTLLASVAILVHLARSQDQRSLQQSHFYAEKALQARQESTLRVLVDNAIWADAYKNLSLRVDLGWAYDNQNLGSALYHTFGYEGVLVIDPAGHTRYAVINGELAQIDARQWLQGNLEALLNLARDAVEDEDNPAVIELMQVQGRPALVAAAELQPDTDARPGAEAGAASILLFVDILTEEKLATLGRDYALPNLRVHSPEATLQAGPLLRLGEADGRPVMLSWDPEQPGRHLLQWVLPLIAVAALVLAGLTWQVLRHALGAIRLLDSGYARLTQNRAELAVSEARLRDVAEVASDWFWETDAELRLTYLSERFAAVTGHPPSHWLGQRLEQLLDCEGPELGVALGDERNTLTCRYTAANGHQRICRLVGRRIRADAPVAGYRGSASDITEEAQAQARIQYLSQHDTLTGLPNRHQLHEFLQGKLRQPPSLTQPLVMLSIDLNRFKPINDVFGHAAGDRVLHEVSQRLRSCIRDEDLVARHGGDEFIMVLGGCYSEQAVEQICMRLIETVEQPYRLQAHEVFLGISIGISSAPADACEVEELLRYADIALYQAKASGRSGWRFYSQEMNQHLVERRQLEQDLRQALTSGDQLQLHFQPRYRLQGKGLAGAEALVRWQHPQRGMIAPDQFIGIAEETGLIVPLGEWVLRRACQQAMSWDEPLLVSVNLSPLQFRRYDLVQQVEAILAETGLPPARLELEITESVMIDDAEGALVALTELKALGLRLSLDDFGTG